MMKTPLGANRTQLRLTLRDVEVLEAIYTARYMTAPQIQALFWRENRGGHWGQRKACQRRLRQLFAHGLVRRIEPLIRYSEGKKPLIYALDKAGAQVLTDELGLDPADLDYKPQTAEESNYPFLQHLLDTTELHIAFTKAAEVTGCHLELWHNERDLKSAGLSDVITLTDPDGKKQKAALVPDALVCLNRQEKQAFFFIEIDRRTVTVDPSQWEKRGWSRKVRTYTAYFASNAYTQRYGDKLIHVLTVTTGEQRLSHLKAATEQAGGGKRFWYTTFALATRPDQLLTGKIWQRAGVDDLHALLA